ncbi:hypothetical protein FAUST_2802 [Fusarium austroamericanum]|uniref:chitinase n=1 Tax=Fusarium austroamericanum TaxID=282268 RepID=A0AAN6HIE4_FUSAU|nr:hypothetical protein FAUST_2802 [Fusarium austroamericanum]
MTQVMPPKPILGPISLSEKKRLSLPSLSDSSQWSRLDNSFASYPDSPLLSSSSSSEFVTAVGQTLCHFAQVTQQHEPVVAVIGVGYVGKHLVNSFSSRYQVIGFDVSATRIQNLKNEYQDNENVQFSQNSQDLRRATHFLISVPTLLRPDKTIDSSCLREALKTVGEIARSGSTVVIESSVAVGMTRQLLGPLAVSRKYFAGMSPERVDPGRAQPPVESIPKVISGLDDITPGSLDAISRIYSTIFDSVVPVSKPEVAEMMKLYENCQRMVCIAYTNEMADACIPHNIDPYEVCEAASTKPFGYMPYTPSVGSLPSVGVCFTGDAVSAIPASSESAEDSASESRTELVRSLAVSHEVNVCWVDALVKQEAFPQVRRLPDEDWRRDVLETFDVIVVASRQPSLDFGLLDELEGVEVERWCQASVKADYPYVSGDWIHGHADYRVPDSSPINDLPFSVNENGTLRAIDDWADNEKMVDGEKGCLAAISKLKSQHPHIKTLVSIGGGSSSKEFPALAANKTARQTFARRISEFCVTHQFDGVDIDWEHPQTPEAGRNYVLFLQDIRNVMTHSQFLLTSALPTGEYCLKHINLPVVAHLLDFLNLMGYDFTGGWTDVCGHHAQLLPPSQNLNEVYPTLRKSCQRGVDFLIANGFPRHKIILGIPVYARYFGQARGPGHPFKGAGEIDYCDLPDEWVANAEVDQSVAAASFVDNKSDKGFVSFDVPSTVSIKAGYAKALGLGGLFYWTGAGDRKGCESLVTAGWTALNS